MYAMLITGLINAIKPIKPSPTTYNKALGDACVISGNIPAGVTIDSSDGSATYKPPSVCSCRKASGFTSGWCGVAGFGVPACDH